MATAEVYAAETAESSTRRYGDEELEPGTLLEEGNRKKVAETAVRMWESQDRRMRRREEQWQVNEWRRQGYSNARLVKKDVDLQDVRAWLPPNVTPDTISSMNKAAKLCRRFTSMMFADPPVPDPLPYSQEDEDVAAAEFTGRMLTDLQSQAKLNDPKKHRRAFDRAHTFDSGFIRYWVEETGGGKAPIEISAGFDPGAPQFNVPSRAATHVDEAIIDPQTGDEWPEYTERFVRPDGSLTMEVTEAAVRNLPRMRSEVLTGRNVRLYPHTAEDVWEADAAQVVTFRTWGEVRSMFPEMDDVSDERRDKLFEYKPKNSKYLMSGEQKRIWSSKPDNVDDRLVMVLTTYFTETTDYPKGAYVVTLGDSEAPVQEEWCMEGPDGIEICLPLPLTQHKLWEEGSDDAYGVGTMQLLGPGNEIRAHVIANLFDHYKKLLNRKTFLPYSSTMRPQDWRRLPSDVPVRINPGGEPKYEEIPSFPNDGMSLFQIMSDEMENDVGLPQIAQGLESPQVQSGRHAQAIMSQVHAGLSEIRQNIIDAYLRACEIQIKLVRAFFDAPMRTGWVGEDGAYKERYWRGTDLRFTSDVQLAAGSMTMLSPIAKVQLAEHMAGLGIIRQDELRDIESGSIGGMLGLQDDPFIMRIRRQIAIWKEGPPSDFQPAFQEQPVVDPNTGQPVVNQFTGQPETQRVQAMDPETASVWAPVAADDEPFVALTRLREMAKTMSSSRFLEQPAEWRWGLEREYQRAKAAASVAGPQPGQPPAQARSPAQRPQGPLAQPETPLPDASGPIQTQ